MFTGKFWRNAAERAIATAAETAVAFIGFDTFVNAVELDWGTIAGVSAGAGFLAVLKALAATKVGDPEDGSLVTYQGRHAA